MDFLAPRPHQDEQADVSLRAAQKMNFTHYGYFPVTGSRSGAPAGVGLASSSRISRFISPVSRTCLDDAFRQVTHEVAINAPNFVYRYFRAG